MKRTPVLVLVSLLVLGVGWSIAPRSALPLYDGVGFPDEPYRFVQRPSGAPDTKAPTTARAQATVRNGHNASLLAASAETAPQVSVQIPPGLLVTPAGTTRVILVATPEKPPPATTGQYLWSNVYDVTASPAAELGSGDLQATITLRAATAQGPEPQIARYASGHWTTMPTFATGQDIYAAQLTQFGRFAVVGTKPLDVSQLAGSGDGKSGGSKIGLVVGAGAVVVLVGLYLLGRRRRATVRRREHAEVLDET